MWHRHWKNYTKICHEMQTKIIEMYVVKQISLLVKK